VDPDGDSDRVRGDDHQRVAVRVAKTSCVHATAQLGATRMMGRTGLGRIRAGVLVACMAFGAFTTLGCGDPIAVAARDVARRTAPPGDVAPSLSQPLWSNQSTQFVWDLDTHLNATAYGAWVRGALADFEVVNATGLALQMGKLIGGDAYRLSITMQSGTASVTHVHVQLTVSPD
jgi:hypothetical protein